MKFFTFLFFVFFALGLSAQSRLININSSLHNESNIITNDSVKKSSFFYQYKRVRPFSLNPEIKNLNEFSTNIEILLNLFPSQTYTASVKSIKRDKNNTLVIQAKIEGSQMGFCIITIAYNGTSMMRIEVPETTESYTTQINPENGLLYLAEFDLSKQTLIDCNEPLSAPKNLSNPNVIENNERNERRRRTSDRTANTITEIDVMVVYTQAAEDWAITNNGSIENTIAIMEGVAQTSFDNSMIELNYNVVYSHKTSYVESGTFVDQLSRLAIKNDGYMDEVHPLRIQENADIVVLLHTIEGGGISYQLQSQEGNPSLAFYSATITGNNVDYLNIHEAGHIFGGGHHKEQLFQPGPGIFDYSAGWRWDADNDLPRASILTYGGSGAFDDGVPHYHIYYFSNPNITYLGTPIGDLINGDNARTIREMKDIIGAYSDNLIGCSGGYQWPLNTTYTPSTTTQLTYAYTLYYTKHNVIAGNTYFWSLCPDDGGESSIDSQLTLINDMDESFLAFNEDTCGDNAKITWEANLTGEVRVLMTKNDCAYEEITATLAFGIDTSSIIYEVVTTANPVEGGSTTGDGNYGFEEAVTVTAVENTGYHFVNWTENGTTVSTSPSYSFIAQSDRNLIANFELNTYTIAANPNPENAGQITGSGSFVHGEICTLSTTENTGYTFSNWSENGTVVSTASNYSFTVETDRSFIANFEADIFEILAMPNPAEGGTIIGAGQYAVDTECILIATNNNGYGFVNWTEDGNVISTDNNYSFTVTADRNLEGNFAEVTLIPDPNFEQALIDLGIDTDNTINGRVYTTDIATIYALDVSHKSISDLSGIEDFGRLTYLDCSNNQITSLDLSQNPLLEHLSCGENEISTLDLTSNTALINLYCSNNPSLSLLNIDSCLLLENIQCYNNQLSQLDVSNNPYLETFYMFNTQLSSLDVSQNSHLRELLVEMNQISSLDLSNNPALTIIDCRDNPLGSLNVQNGNNNIVEIFWATNNPNLSCIQVDDEAAANAGTGIYQDWLKDQSASYSENCTMGIDEYAWENSIVIFPNPTTQMITVNTANNVEIQSLTISNIAGQIVKSINSKNPIDVSNLSNGLYFIQIKTNQGTISKKLIKE